MKTTQLTARARTEKGSRACRKLRGEGFVPANLYGADKKGDDPATLENVNLAVSAYDLLQLIEKKEPVLEVNWGSRKELAQLVEVQRDAFGDDLLHVDLRKIDVDKPIHGAVQLVFKGEPKGVKEGGQLQTQMHNLEIEALPRAMPREILVRLDDLGLNESLHVKDLPLPEGATALTPPDQLVAQVVPPMEETEDEAAAGEPLPTEPEVIGKAKEDEGGDS